MRHFYGLATIRPSDRESVNTTPLLAVYPGDCYATANFPVRAAAETCPYYWLLLAESHLTRATLWSHRRADRVAALPAGRVHSAQEKT